MYIYVCMYVCMYVVCKFICLKYNYIYRIQDVLLGEDMFVYYVQYMFGDIYTMYMFVLYYVILRVYIYYLCIY